MVFFKLFSFLVELAKSLKLLLTLSRSYLPTPFDFLLRIIIVLEKKLSEFSETPIYKYFEEKGCSKSFWELLSKISTVESFLVKLQAFLKVLKILFRAAILCRICLCKMELYSRCNHRNFSWISKTREA